MKSLLILLTLLFFINYSYAQEQKTNYLPNNTFVKEDGKLDENGYPIGIWKYYLENGSLEYQIDWETNYITKYYLTGEIKEEGTFIPETGVHINKWITYFKNGSINTIEIFDKNGIKK